MVLHLNASPQHKHNYQSTLKSWTHIALEMNTVQLKQDTISKRWCSWLQITIRSTTRIAWAQRKNECVSREGSHVVKRLFHAKESRHGNRKCRAGGKRGRRRKDRKAKIKGPAMGFTGNKKQLLQTGQCRERQRELVTGAEGKTTWLKLQQQNSCLTQRRTDSLPGIFFYKHLSQQHSWCWTINFLVSDWLITH